MRKGPPVSACRAHNERQRCFGCGGHTYPIALQPLSPRRDPAMVLFRVEFVGWDGTTQAMYFCHTCLLTVGEEVSREPTAIRAHWTRPHASRG
jgi:hypothetical protein